MKESSARGMVGIVRGWIAEPREEKAVAIHLPLPQPSTPPPPRPPRPAARGPVGGQNVKDLTWSNVISQGKSWKSFWSMGATARGACEGETPRLGSPDPLTENKALFTLLKTAGKLGSGSNS